jgi:hypothetical protein
VVVALVVLAPVEAPAALVAERDPVTEEAIGEVREVTETTPVEDPPDHEGCQKVNQHKGNSD